MLSCRRGLDLPRDRLVPSPSFSKHYDRRSSAVGDGVDGATVLFKYEEEDDSRWLSSTSRLSTTPSSRHLASSSHSCLSGRNHPSSSVAPPCSPSSSSPSPSSSDCSSPSSSSLGTMLVVGDARSGKRSLVEALSSSFASACSSSALPTSLPWTSSSSSSSSSFSSACRTPMKLPFSSCGRSTVVDRSSTRGHDHLPRSASSPSSGPTSLSPCSSSRFASSGPLEFHCISVSSAIQNQHCKTNHSNLAATAVRASAAPVPAGGSSVRHRPSTHSLSSGVAAAAAAAPKDSQRGQSDDCACFLSVWNVRDRSLLKLAVNPAAMASTVAVIVVDLSRPWEALTSLEKHAEALRETASSAARTVREMAAGSRRSAGVGLVGLPAGGGSVCRQGVGALGSGGSAGGGGGEEILAGSSSKLKIGRFSSFDLPSDVGVGTRRSLSADLSSLYGGAYRQLDRSALGSGVALLEGGVGGRGGGGEGRRREDSRMLLSKKVHGINRSPTCSPAKGGVRRVNSLGGLCRFSTASAAADGDIRMGGREGGQWLRGEASGKDDGRWGRGGGGAGEGREEECSIKAIATATRSRGDDGGDERPLSAGASACGDAKMQMVVVGTKADLLTATALHGEGDHAALQRRLLKACQSIGAGLVYTSMKSGLNISKLRDQVLQILGRQSSSSLEASLSGPECFLPVGWKCEKDGNVPWSSGEETPGQQSMSSMGSHGESEVSVGDSSVSASGSIVYKSLSSSSLSSSVCSERAKKDSSCADGAELPFAKESMGGGAVEVEVDAPADRDSMVSGSLSTSSGSFDSADEVRRLHNEDVFEDLSHRAAPGRHTLDRDSLRTLGRSNYDFGKGTNGYLEDEQVFLARHRVRLQCLMEDRKWANRREGVVASPCVWKEETQKPSGRREVFGSRKLC
ncbi:hypothetical protein CBR_g27750 [Chara braunii]|uniref:Dynein light intermediate chain n=1 Tax=Chara braunii TaxID=69332 RepID=A0A388L886_CHABU|nr:hypothetical protein CBR_g27750 [Chara braunii]|eukprot:GBG78525.1 hypothetical protein CBR_g27750 [Chara braunii]